MGESPSTLSRVCTSSPVMWYSSPRSPTITSSSDRSCELRYCSLAASISLRGCPGRSRDLPSPSSSHVKKSPCFPRLSFHTSWYGLRLEPYLCLVSFCSSHICGSSMMNMFPLSPMDSQRRIDPEGPGGESYSGVYDILAPTMPAFPGSDGLELDSLFSLRHNAPWDAAQLPLLDPGSLPALLLHEDDDIDPPDVRMKRIPRPAECGDRLVQLRHGQGGVRVWRTSRP
mmetsp:Transcript_12206/g.38651  ORF Transcript_12206/g.38651 Transcript_12206/m.38651 type:complete len:228 (+) Transcript_12206:411-1094(+)